MGIAGVTRRSTKPIRIVKPIANGRWLVVGSPNGEGRPASSLATALDRARAMLMQLGGGLLLVHGEDGLQRVETVAPCTDCPDESLDT